MFRGQPLYLGSCRKQRETSKVTSHRRFNPNNQRERVMKDHERKAWVALALDFLHNDRNTTFRPVNLCGGNSTKSNYLSKAGNESALRSQLGKN